MATAQTQEYTIALCDQFIHPVKGIAVCSQSDDEVTLKLPDTNNLLVLNQSSAAVWKACKHGRSVVDIISEITWVYGGSTNTGIVNDIQHVLVKLENAGLVEVFNYKGERCSQSKPKSKSHQIKQPKDTDTQTSSRKVEIKNLLNSIRPVKCEYNLIRLGPDGDGGYLVPDDIDGIALCISPGVGKTYGFELSCINYGMTVHMVDASVDAPSIVNGDNVHFHQKNLSGEPGQGLITIDEVIERSEISEESDLLLQMDIEGGEFAVLPILDEAVMTRFRTMVIEFHQIHRLWDDEYFAVFKDCFNKLLKNHYCVHIHPNNCCGTFQQKGISLPRVMEFTFHRKNRVMQSEYSNVFPHPLDQSNISGDPLYLPGNWFGSSDISISEILDGRKGVIYIGENIGRSAEKYASYINPMFWLQVVFNPVNDQSIRTRENGSWSTMQFGKQETAATPLSELLGANGIDIDAYDVLWIDDSGLELDSLKYAEISLDKIIYVVGKIPIFESQHGGCQFVDYNQYLLGQEFEEVMRGYSRAIDENSCFLDLVYRNKNYKELLASS